jgi:hypothetical protein
MLIKNLIKQLITKSHGTRYGDVQGTSAVRIEAIIKFTTIVKRLPNISKK